MNTYRFDDDSYLALGAAGVPWMTALWVLRHAHPTLRRSIGAVLQFTGLTQDDTPLVVVLIEEDNDEYLVVSAYWPDFAEAEFIRHKLIRGGTS